jgi:acetyl esterase
MPLDPKVEQLLGWARRSEGGSYAQMTPTAARVHYARASRTLDIAAIPLAEVHDHRVDLGDRVLALRQYAPRPLSWADPLPGLLYFHGGGFTIGSIETHDALCRRLAAGAGCQVLSLAYRLAPEYRFPAAADDSFDGLHWILREAASLGLDAGRLAVGGDSAGGTLAAATALHARDRGIALALQLLVYPGMSARQDTASHRRLARGYLLDADVIQWFFGNYLRSDADRDDWRFAPLAAASVAGVAPAWIAVAQYDPLHDEGVAYAEKLRAAGVEVDLVDYDGMIHAFFQHGGYLETARRAHAQASAALARALGTAVRETASSHTPG